MSIKYIPSGVGLKENRQAGSQIALGWLAGTRIQNNHLVPINENIPRFRSLGGISPTNSTTYSDISVLPHHRTYSRTLSNMDTLPSGNGGPSLTHGPSQYGISNTGTNNNTNNSIHGDSNQNIGNVLNSYNNTITVGISEEASRIQTWLSPLEPHTRHQDVRNRRLDGVGDWVLEKNEFESWRESQDSSANRTLLCYGDQGAGKTYIRYQGIVRGR